MCASHSEEFNGHTVGTKGKRIFIVWQNVCVSQLKWWLILLIAFSLLLYGCLPQLLWDFCELKRLWKAVGKHNLCYAFSCQQQHNVNIISAAALCFFPILIFSDAVNFNPTKLTAVSLSREESKVFFSLISLTGRFLSVFRKKWPYMFSFSLFISFSLIGKPHRNALLHLQ